MTVTIAAVVEGDGDVRALPLLLRRIAHELSVWDVDVPPPLRRPRSKLLAPGGIETAVEAQAYRVGEAGGVLVLVDADDDCPATMGPDLLRRAQAVRPDKKIAVVLAKREFEAWFLASARSLAGRHSLSQPLDPPSDPEAIRAAKEWLGQRMAGHSYRPTVDQPGFAAVFDMVAARQNSASFDKFWRETERLLSK